MKKKEYLEKRKSLMNKAQTHINEGQLEEAQNVMNEVSQLDADWDAFAQAQASFQALKNEPKEVNPLNYGGIFGGSEPEKDESETKVVKAWKSKEYENAWAKTLMNLSLTEKETDAFKIVNEAYTHTKENTSLVIPNNVSKGIWEMVGEMYPYFEDVTKTYVNGILSMIQEDTSTDAKWYDEETSTEDGKETFKEFKLSGCELSRSITISWKLKEMSIEDFIPYIQRKMAKKMGAAAGYGVTHGKGTENKSKPEPVGVVTALKKESDEPQIVRYTKGGMPTYNDIVKARSKVKSGYGASLNIYANSNTIWNKLAAIEDKTGKPLFMPDPANGGTFRILGMLVKEDDSMKDGEILMSNPGSGYHLNINKEMSMMTEDHVKPRTTDYCGYAIMDGNVTTTRAHALLLEKESIDTGENETQTTEAETKK